MASFNIVGFDNVEKMLLERSEKATAAAPKMLQAGAEVLVEGQRDEVESTFTKTGRGTGDLAASIKAGKVQGDSLGKFIEVYPDGKDRHGVRNATKGFVLQYGRSNMPGIPWLTAANEKASDKVHAAMREEWEKAT